ncbi:hypothetical protein D1007_25641 [Hordeum vulgare]|nr:hypothetical protein D1007_25641 [Hordeum vulgare]
MNIFAWQFPLPLWFVFVDLHPTASDHHPRSPVAVMEAFKLLFVTVEVSHVPNPPTDPVTGHVVPDVVQPLFVPPRKRQGSSVIQGGLSTVPVGKAHAPAARGVIPGRLALARIGTV